MKNKTEILDTTLREGEQCYGVFFSIETKKRLARLLDQAGVDFIEAGHPAAAPSIRQAAAEMARMGLNARLIGHARLDMNEIRVVSDLGLPWVGLFCGVNDRSLERYGISKQVLFERAETAVREAKKLGLRVKFTCEDASRTDISNLAGFYDFLDSLGVDRLSYADTLGISTPVEIRAIRKRFSFEKLHFHFHNDRGMAFENALAAAECGARCIDASVLGIGERAGLVPLEPAVSALRGFGGYVRNSLSETERIVRGAINQERFIRRRFAHKSGIHINGILKDPSNYEAFGPEAADNQRLLVLSKLIGKSGLKKIFSQFGINVDDRRLARILEQVKSDEFLELGDSGEIETYLREKFSRYQIAVMPG